MSFPPRGVTGPSGSPGRRPPAPPAGSFALTAVCLVVVILVGCSGSQRSVRDSSVRSTVVLISLDGFRWDFMDRYATPTLDRLAAEGVRAETLIPIFPTKTFPNHYSAVTGLYAEHHGIISNTMYDPHTNAYFSLSDREAISDAGWWAGEPIWVTAETQGQVTATYFWPGSEAPIQGVQPTYWYAFDRSVPGNERVDQVFKWLERPVQDRPSFITLYFSDVDAAGHDQGPDSPAVADAAEQVDAYLGRLVAGLEQRSLLDRVHLIVISDHGMIETSPDRYIVLDRYFDPAGGKIVDYSPVLMMYPEEGTLAETVAALRTDPHLEVFVKDSLPERFHLDHPRTPPVVAVAEPGWSITTRARLAERPNSYRGSTHGYDNRSPSMGGLFIARGPALKRGVTVPSFEIIQLYELMCGILGLEPAPNDGRPDALNHLLTDQPTAQHDGH